MTDEPRGAFVRRPLPEAWETGPSFEDQLHAWMNRAPWLAISAVAHVMLFFLLLVIPWNIFEQREPKVVHVGALDPIEDIVEDPPEEELPEELPEEIPEEPQLQESEDLEPASETEAEDSASDLGDPDLTSDVDLDAWSTTPLLGLGGGPAGPYGDRFPGSGRGRRGSGHRPEIDRGLSWLAAHQDPDGKWDSDEFMKHDPAGDPCDGPGRAEHDVGLTALALLAFLGDGNTPNRGRYRDTVARGIHWLRGQQDYESGLVGRRVGTAFLYDHGLAALALCEAYYFTKSPVLRTPAQKAIELIGQARNPYGVWRYAVPPSGDGDTSVTGWMVFALESAKEAGLAVDSQAFPDALTWFDELTDPATGRVGYDSPGSLSARVPGMNDHYPAERGEAMTAVALLCRFFLGQDPGSEPAMRQHADLLLQCLPEWSADGAGNDVYYWYYGSYAMYQMGGKHWRAWSRAMGPAIVDTQRREGATRGSWDPDGPWGMVGGRVYSTAMMVLCLEVHFRYSRLLGAR